MSSIVAAIQAFLLVLTFLYAVTTFVTWEADFGAWPIAGRLIVVTVSAIAGIIAYFSETWRD